MSDTDLLAMLAQVMASIDASLKDIAAFARYQHQAATGEKVHEIAGYVRSENAGGALVHLYSTHPGLKFRVGAVYSEHFAELPFDATKGKPWDGEAAPSIETAKTKGYFVPVAPFSASFLPTGQTTDAGLPVYRFSRVVGGAGRTVPAGEGAPLLQSAPVQNGNGNGQKAAAMATPAQSAEPKAVVSTPAPAPATPQPAPRKVSIIRTLPLDPAQLKAWIVQEAGYLADHGRTASKTQVGATHNALVKLVPEEATRHVFQAWLTGNASMADWPLSLVLAVHNWLKPAAGNGPTDGWCRDEVALALDLLRPVSQPVAVHPVWETKEDAAEWAFRQGVFPDAATALASLTVQWNAWGKPENGALFDKWEHHVAEMRQQ